MKKTLILLCIFAFLSVVQPARAQDDMPANALIPTSAWLVGPASIAASIGNIASKIPCVVANQYNNGFIVRFSGGNNTLMALAIDFKQKSFTHRKRYDIELSVPGQFFQVISGAAYDESTLIFNLQKIPGLYEALQSAEEMTLKLEGTSLRFALIGLDDGFKRMEICYNPSIEGPSPLGPTPAPNLPSRAEAEGLTPQNPLIAKDTRLTPMPGEGGTPTPQDQAAAPAALPDLMAKAQEAEQVAAELASHSPQKPKPVEPAGEQMAQGWTGTQPMRNAADTDIMTKQPGKEVYVRREMRWRALKGANLREVLNLWAEGSGTELIWLSPRDFAVQRSLSQQSTFEGAAQSLLEQYSEMDPRPVGRVYREPGTSKLVLVVEMSGSR